MISCRNELADWHAKLAASEAQTILDNPVVFLQTAKASRKSLPKVNWQRAWARGEKVS